jgi:hypothetical protein
MYRSMSVALRNFRRPNTIIWPQSERYARQRGTAAGAPAARSLRGYSDPSCKIMPISSLPPIMAAPLAVAAAPIPARRADA